MKKNVCGNGHLSWRNSWPGGTRGGVTQTVKSKKGKGSYKREKMKGNYRDSKDNYPSSLSKNIKKPHPYSLQSECGLCIGHRI